MKPGANLKNRKNPDASKAQFLNEPRHGNGKGFFLDDKDGVLFHFLLRHGWFCGDQVPAREEKAEYQNGDCLICWFCPPIFA